MPVVVACGHMTDAPGRKRPRFPQDQVARVGTEIAFALSTWAVEGGASLLCGGARGADLLAAECAQRRGARVTMFVPAPLDEFERVSVHVPGTDWRSRFSRLLKLVELEVVPVREGDLTPFERVNDCIIQAALGLDEFPRLLAVWDGRAGDGPGGTEDLMTRFGSVVPPGHRWIIDPRPPNQDAAARPRR